MAKLPVIQKFHLWEKSPLRPDVNLTT